MPGKVRLSEKQMDILRKISREATASVRLVQRSRIILLGYVAEIEKIAQSTLGRKSRCGILKSMPSRQEFLSDKSHRVRFVDLPLHSSWLNQIERIFGFVRGRVLRRGSFHSTAELKDRMQEFITNFNNTFATPFDWTDQAVIAQIHLRK